MFESDTDSGLLEDVLKEYRENPWVQQLSRDYRTRKLNLEKGPNYEQTLKLISRLKERVMSDSIVLSGECEAKRWLEAKLRESEAERRKLNARVNALQSCMNALKSRDQTSQGTIQRLSKELEASRCSAKEYRSLEKTLSTERRARLSLDKKYKKMVANRNLSLETLKTISDEYKRDTLALVRDPDLELGCVVADCFSADMEDGINLQKGNVQEELD